MAIKIKNLENLTDQYTSRPYVYKDLTLDLTTTKIAAPGLELPVNSTDIKSSFDLEAISNSLTNLFNTSPGQRFLFPEYGLSLQKYLFEQATLENGKAIADKIFRTIKIYEPRIRPTFVDVIVDPDNNQYEFTISIEIPILRRATNIGFVFDLRKQTFVSLPVQVL